MPCALHQPPRSSGAIDWAASSTNTTSPHEIEFAHPSGRTVERAALFVRPEIRPRLDGPAEQLGLEVDHIGFVLVDNVGRTSVAGVWAAGNVANPRAQVITAAGEGSAAAIAINADLVQEDTRNAL